MNHSAKELNRDSNCESIATGVLALYPSFKKLVSGLHVKCDAVLSPSHIQVLAYLVRYETVTVSKLSKSFGIAKPNITPIIDHLTDAGLVERAHNTTDRRVVFITVLPKGVEVYNKLVAQMAEELKDMLKDMSAKDVDSLAGDLDSAAKLLSDK